MTDDYTVWMLGQGLSPRTIEQRSEFAAWRLREWGAWPIDSATLASWLAQYSGWSRMTYHGHLCSIYRWLLETGQITKSPMEGIRRPPTPAPRPRPLSADQVESVLQGTTGHLRTWMLLALLAGLRVHEIAKIKGEDVDEQRIRVIGKGGKSASVPTHPDIWALAQQYPRDGLWFPSLVKPGQPYTYDHISKMVAYRFREAGIRSGSIHRLRATYGTDLVRNGANLRIVQTLMRHSSLATTEHYLGVDEDERTAAVALLTSRADAATIRTQVSS